MAGIKNMRAFRALASIADGLKFCAAFWATANSACPLKLAVCFCGTLLGFALDQTFEQRFRFRVCNSRLPLVTGKGISGIIGCDPRVINRMPVSAGVNFTSDIRTFSFSRICRWRGGF